MNQINTASTNAKRTATVSIAGSASTAIFARMLLTPQITAIETSWIMSSGAKARDGWDTRALRRIPEQCEIQVLAEHSSSGSGAKRAR
ncbi:MAG: hypothetical protein IPL62_14040 [Caulobacteraceae bacterium]|nr:hypothetical protein [Caulobacteraceae bacterium]